MNYGGQIQRGFKNEIKEDIEDEEIGDNADTDEHYMV